MNSDNIFLYVKKFLLLGRYYLRSIVKRTLGIIPFSLFLLTFLLFLIVLIPSLRERIGESPLFSPEPHTLEVFGVVTKEIDAPDSKVTVPVAGIIVEIGAFRTTTNLEGIYDIRIPFQENANIPIIFRTDDQEILVRVSFFPGQFRMQKDITLK